MGKASRLMGKASRLKRPVPPLQPEAALVAKDQAQLLASVKRRHPGLWRFFYDARSMRGRELPWWPE